MVKKKEKDKTQNSAWHKLVAIDLRANKKTKKDRLTESLRENLKKRKVQARNRAVANKMTSNVDLKKE